MSDDQEPPDEPATLAGPVTVNMDFTGVPPGRWVRVRGLNSAGEAVTIDTVLPDAEPLTLPLRRVDGIEVLATPDASQRFTVSMADFLPAGGTPMLDALRTVLMDRPSLRQFAINGAVGEDPARPYEAATPEELLDAPGVLPVAPLLIWSGIADAPYLTIFGEAPDGRGIRETVEPGITTRQRFAYVGRVDAAYPPEPTPRMTPEEQARWKTDLRHDVAAAMADADWAQPLPLP